MYICCVCTRRIYSFYTYLSIYCCIYLSSSQFNSAVSIICRLSCILYNTYTMLDANSSRQAVFVLSKCHAEIMYLFGFRSHFKLKVQNSQRFKCPPITTIISTLQFLKNPIFWERQRHIGTSRR